MKLLSACLLFFLFFLAPLFAQSFVTSGPPSAATRAVFEASAGYTYVVLDTPSQPRVGLSGVDANGFVDLTANWGLMADASYARMGDVLNTGHSANLFSLMSGPVFYPVRYFKTRIFVHTLAGVSLVDSAVPVSGTHYLGGPLTRFSYALGGGVERTVAGSFALRIGSDYLRTTFADSSAAMRFQHNLRIITGLSYRFGKR
jgi:hypothetical protein